MYVCVLADCNFTLHRICLTGISMKTERVLSSRCLLPHLSDTSTVRQVSRHCRISACVFHSYYSIDCSSLEIWSVVKYPFCWSIEQFTGRLWTGPQVVIMWTRVCSTVLVICPGHWIHFHTSDYLNSLGSIQLLLPFGAACYFTEPAPPTGYPFSLLLGGHVQLRQNIIGGCRVFTISYNVGYVCGIIQQEMRQLLSRQSIAW